MVRYEYLGNIKIKRDPMNQSEIAPKNKGYNSDNFKFRIPPSLKKALIDRASSTGENPSAIVREALKSYLEAA